MSKEGQGSGPRLRVAVAEPFWAGSHRAFAEGWAAASRHRIRITHLPARFWKWRMRGAAFPLARRLGESGASLDVLLATDLVDVAHLLALLRCRPPTIVYFHENQVAYAGRPGEAVPERDLQYAFTNLASAAAADAVAFNSAFQRDAFLAGMEALLRRMPDLRPLWTLDQIAQRSRVLPLGVALSDIPPRPAPEEEPLLILWNHRWEHDKDPEAFFRVLGRLDQRGVPFRLAVAGESFARAPAVFPRARQELAKRIVHWGYLERRQDYVGLLARADVVVSTARQENFGISVVEAAYAGAHPLVPARLSYPEVLPRELHGRCLYRDEEDLERRLGGLLTGTEAREDPGLLRERLRGYRWETRTQAYDRLVEQVFESRDLWYF